MYYIEFYLHKIQTENIMRSVRSKTQCAFARICYKVSIFQLGEADTKVHSRLERKNSNRNFISQPIFKPSDWLF